MKVVKQIMDVSLKDKVKVSASSMVRNVADVTETTLTDQRRRLLFMFFDPCKDDISVAVCRIGQEYCVEKDLCRRVPQRQNQYNEKRDRLGKRQQFTTIHRVFTPRHGRKVFDAANKILFETGHKFRLWTSSVKHLLYKDQKHLPEAPHVYSTRLEKFLKKELYPLYNYNYDGRDDVVNKWISAVPPLQLSTYAKYQSKLDKYMFAFMNKECYKWFFTRLRESAENFIQSRIQLQNLLYSPNIGIAHVGYSSFTDPGSNTMLIPYISNGDHTLYEHPPGEQQFAYYGTQKLDPEDAFRYGIWSPAYIDQGKIATNFPPSFDLDLHEYNPIVSVSVMFSEAIANAKSRGWIYVVDMAGERYGHAVLNIIPPKAIVGYLDMVTGYYFMTRSLNNNQGDESSPNQCSMCEKNQLRTECNWDPMVSGVGVFRHLDCSRGL